MDKIFYAAVILIGLFISNESVSQTKDSLVAKTISENIILVQTKSGYSYLGQTPPGLLPQIFAPGIVSSAFHDVRITFTPDLKECYFYIVYKQNDSINKWTTLASKNL